MKRYAIIPVMFLVAALSFAESVWSGNAAVGGSADFTGSSDTYRALSNSFPPGTMLSVTNPRNGSIVDVLVSGRLDTPGVFIVVEKEAGELISLPLDHVVPVKVSPIGLVSDENDVETELSPVIVEAPVNPETIISYEIPDDVEDVVIEDAIIEEMVLEESLIEEEIELTLDEEASEESGTQKFFLMPSDPKPPELVEAETPIAVSPEPVTVPVGSLAQIKKYGSGTFVQIGAYTNLPDMELAANQIGLAAPGYPLGYAETESSKPYVYKLLVGPLSSAEVGIVLETARNTAFPDAFRYSQ